MLDNIEGAKDGTKKAVEDIASEVQGKVDRSTRTVVEEGVIKVPTEEVK